MGSTVGDPDLSFVFPCLLTNWIQFNSILLSLKGPCDEDFAILGQFCAKITTQCLYSYTKCPCNTMKKISNEFYKRQLTIIIFLEIFKSIASKREKIGDVSIHFHPCHR